MGCAHVCVSKFIHTIWIWNEWNASLYSAFWRMRARTSWWVKWGPHCLCCVVFCVDSRLPYIMDAGAIVKRFAVYSAGVFFFFSAHELCYSVFQVFILLHLSIKWTYWNDNKCSVFASIKGIPLSLFQWGWKNTFRSIKGTLRDKLEDLLFFLGCELQCSAESASHILAEEHDYVFATLLARLLLVQWETLVTRHFLMHKLVLSALLSQTPAKKSLSEAIMFAQKSLQCVLLLQPCEKIASSCPGKTLSCFRF